MRPKTAHPERVLTLLAVTSLAGCALVEGFLEGSAEERLVSAAVTIWAEPGRVFVEGAVGRDTVGTTSETGEHAWLVTVPDGAVSEWAFEVARAEVFVVHDGAAYSEWLGSTARELGLRSLIPPEATSLVQDGSVVAFGDLEVRYGHADRAGRNTIARVAYLHAAADGSEEWRIVTETRAMRVIRDALRTVYGDMIVRDQRVHSCMGNVDARSVPRSTQLACVAEALERDYGGG